MTNTPPRVASHDGTITSHDGTFLRAHMDFTKLCFLTFTLHFAAVFWPFISRVARYTPSSRPKNTLKIKANLEFHKSSNDFIASEVGHKNVPIFFFNRHLFTHPFITTFLRLQVPSSPFQNDLTPYGVSAHTIWYERSHHLMWALTSNGVR